MTMDRRRLMLWAVLVFSVFFTARQLSNRQAAAPPAQAPAAAAAPQGAAGAVVATAVPEAVPATPLPPSDLVAWRAGVGGLQRDPFFTASELAAMGRPVNEGVVAVAPPVAPPAYTLKLVLMEGSEGRALIDTQVVKVGDRVGDERVAEILPDSVVLERDGARRRLQVAGSTPVQITLERNR